eukprot:2650757-Pyramimonas_sp.AAC.1
MYPAGTRGGWVVRCPHPGLAARALGPADMHGLMVVWSPETSLENGPETTSLESGPEMGRGGHRGPLSGVPRTLSG